jgi:glycosyltransferase involved in cell wall biosynthesis
MPHKISVALATYNGACYLPDFLDSILRQEQLPAELIACDDGSDDETVAVLESFSKKAPFAVKIYQNQTRLGVAQNFSRAISLCESDFIALADQDDVWLVDKLTQVAKALMFSGCAAVFSDTEVVTQYLRPLGYTMWQRTRFNEHEQEIMRNGQSFDVLLKHKVVTGATLGFKKSLSDALLPLPSDWPHDAWIAFIAAATGGLYPLNIPLIQYRQHETNVIGGLKKSLWEEVQSARKLHRANWYREELAKLHVLEERLRAIPVPQPIQEKLARKIAHLEVRSGLPKSRFQRLSIVAHEVIAGRYAAYARNWGSIAIDLLVK